jgi:acetylglutamate kinase
LKALGNTATTCAIIDGRQQHALLHEVDTGGCGTTIQSTLQG